MIINVLIFGIAYVLDLPQLLCSIAEASFFEQFDRKTCILRPRFYFEDKTTVVLPSEFNKVNILICTTGSTLRFLDILSLFFR